MLSPDLLVQSCSPGETRLALLADGKVLALHVDRGAPAAGEVMLGRVSELNRRLSAAFIDIGQAQPAFLGRIEPGLSVGAPVLVKIKRAAYGRKGASCLLLPMDPAASGLTPPVRLSSSSPLARLLAEHPSVSDVLVDRASDLAAARAVFPKARWQRNCFEECGAAESLEQALEAWVPLAGGGGLIIEATAAAVMIDIDSGGGNPLTTNLAAVIEIGRQIRLRGLAGHILVDVIPMGDRQILGRLVKALRVVLADDPIPSQVVGTTPLGMVEITRERRHPSLAEVMLEGATITPTTETVALEALRAVLREAEERPGAVLRLAAPPRVISALRCRPALLVETESQLGRPLVLREDRSIERYGVEEMTR